MYDFSLILNEQQFGNSVRSLMTRDFFGNSGQDYVIALTIVILGVLTMVLFKGFILAKLRSISEKTGTGADDIIVMTLASIHWPLYLLASLHIVVQFLDLPEIVGTVFGFLFIVSVAFYVVKIVQGLIEYGVQNVAARKEKEEKAHEANAVRKFSVIVKGILWIVAVLVVLSNLGYDVSALIAGLGIGGIAIAFALQNVLGDIFSSISIYLDKPFKVGDFIMIGSDLGVVKKIGIKSTRIQALRGEELIVSNRELTSTRVQNFKKMKKRRISFEFGVVYDTNKKKLEKALEIVKGVIEQTGHADLDRVHFREFGNFSLIFEVVYYIDSSDYNAYMDSQQQINLGIKEGFEKENIEFAYPTQTIMLNKQR